MVVLSHKFSHDLQDLNYFYVYISQRIINNQ